MLFHIFKKKLKDKMNKLICNETKIEQVCNSIDKFGQVVNKEFLLKHWPSFKTKFEKTDRLNNTVLSSINIRNFMNLCI